MLQRFLVMAQALHEVVILIQFSQREITRYTGELFHYQALVVPTLLRKISIIKIVCH
jgi:hypothetical protein